MQDPPCCYLSRPVNVRLTYLLPHLGHSRIQRVRDSGWSSSSAGIADEEGQAGAAASGAARLLSRGGLLGAEGRKIAGKSSVRLETPTAETPSQCASSCVEPSRRAEEALHPVAKRAKCSDAALDTVLVLFDPSEPLHTIYSSLYRTSRSYLSILPVLFCNRSREPARPVQCARSSHSLFSS